MIDNNSSQEGNTAEVAEGSVFPDEAVGKKNNIVTIIVIGATLCAIALIVLVLSMKNPELPPSTEVSDTDEPEILPLLTNEELQNLIVNSIEKVQEEGALVKSSYIGTIENIRRFEGRDYVLALLRPDQLEGEIGKLHTLLNHFSDETTHQAIDIRFDDIHTEYIDTTQAELEDGDVVRVTFAEKAFYNGFLTAGSVQVVSPE